jgi:hypothetical protein
MATVMPLKDSRRRAEQVWLAREIGRQPWSKIRDQFGFTSVGGPQRAHRRYVERHPKPDPAAVLLGIIERNRELGRVAMSELTAAVTDGDHKATAAHILAMIKLDAELARLFGFYATERVDVNVTTDAAAMIAATRERLAVLDADVVDLPAAKGITA